MDGVTAFFHALVDELHYFRVFLEILQVFNAALRG